MSSRLLRFNFILVILSALAMFTPVFSGYVLGLGMIVVMVLSRFEPSMPRWHNVRGQFWRLLRPISKSSLVLLALLIFAGLWAAMDADQLDFKDLRQGLGNAAVKYVILWFAYLSFWWRAAALKKLWRAFVCTYAVAAIVHCIYCLAQRQFGLDWAHGLSGVLGPGRFAYGVYRISGFMGHPLTLGYSQALALVASLTLFQIATERWEKSAWLVATMMSCLVLLVSGSRGPQVSAMFGAILVMPWKSITRHWRIAGALFAVAVICALYLGVFARFFELIDAGVGSDERFLHWSVHWRAFLDHPIHGIGPGSSYRVISAYYLSQGIGDSIKLAHNAFLQFAADYGVLGLSGAVNWVFSWVVVGRSTRFVTRGFSSILAVSFIGSMTQNTYQDSGFIYALTVWTMLLTVREVAELESSCVGAKNKDFVT